MAKIVEYDAKDLKLNPSNVGQQALETGARRVGQFAEQMASGTREVGNLQRELDDDIGKQLTSFMRFKGLEDESGGGVKVKGGNGRTLLGTGTNSGITRNPSDKTGKTTTADNQLDKDKIAAAQKIKDAQDKIASDKAAGELKQARDKEDAQTQQIRDADDAQKQQDRIVVNANLKVGKDADGNPIPADQIDAYTKHTLLEQAALDNGIKEQRAAENADTKQRRDAQDAAITQGADSNALNKITHDYQTKKDLLSGATTLSKLAAQAVAATSPVNTAQQAMSDTDILRGGKPGVNNKLGAQQNAISGTPGPADRQDGGFENSKDKSGLETPDQPGQTEPGVIPVVDGMPIDTVEAQSLPTWTGDTPYVPGQPPPQQSTPDQSAPQIPGSEFSQGGAGPSTFSGPPGIWSGIDNENAPSLYGDMGNGM